MNVLIYRYGSICEPDIISAFSSLGLNVIEETTEIYDKKFSPSACVKLVNELINKHKPIFVFTINFFPVIAEVCHIHNILYLCWTVDCPVLELFSQPMQYPTNRIFLFDREQYNLYHPFNPDCIFYLPLASSVERFDSVISSITTTDKQKYSADISFVGSLYSEKNPLKQINSMPNYIQGYMDGIIEASLQVYGHNFMELAMSDNFIQEFKTSIPNFFSYQNLITNADTHVIAHKYLGFQAAELERIRTLNTLAEHFKIDLYTSSDTSPLHSVRTRGTIESLRGMPKVFHLSKINLNMTIKPIQSGLPLRVFDILGCGGFLMTNYQAELPDYFTIGEDLETYTSIEELIDKCAYYLKHNDIRRKIALNGYEKIKKYHTYTNRIADMFKNSITQ